MSAKITSPNVLLSPDAMARNTLNTTMAVPSFTSDSPSIMCPRTLLAPTSFKMATTATGSVAARIEPTIMQNAQLQPNGKIRNTHPVSAMDNNTPGPANIKTFGSTFFSVCHSIENDDSKISAGKNTANSKCGLMPLHASNDCSRCPSSV